MKSLKNNLNNEQAELFGTARSFVRSIIFF